MRRHHLANTILILSLVLVLIGSLSACKHDRTGELQRQQHCALIEMYDTALATDQTMSAMAKDLNGLAAELKSAGWDDSSVQLLARDLRTNDEADVVGDFSLLAAELAKRCPS